MIIFHNFEHSSKRSNLEVVVRIAVLKISSKFSEHLFLRTPLDDCFWLLPASSAHKTTTRTKQSCTQLHVTKHWAPLPANLDHYIWYSHQFIQFEYKLLFHMPKDLGKMSQSAKNTIRILLAMELHVTFLLFHATLI